MDLVDEKLKVLTAQFKQDLRKKTEPLAKRLDQHQEKLRTQDVRSRIAAVEKELQKMNSQFTVISGSKAEESSDEELEAPAASEEADVSEKDEQEVMDLFVTSKIRETFEPLQQIVEGMRAKLDEHGSSVHTFASELSKIDNHYM